jgi:hypothetical protein
MAYLIVIFVIWEAFSLLICLACCGLSSRITQSEEGRRG